MPAKEGCSVSTTLVDTSASPRAPSSISVRKASRCRCRTLSPLSLLFLLPHQASLSPHGCFQAARGSLSPPGPSAVQPDSLQMSRTSAEVRSASQALPPPHPPFPSSPLFSYKMIRSTIKVTWKTSLSFFTALHQHMETVPLISASGVDKLLRGEIGLCQQEQRCYHKIWSRSAKRMAATLSPWNLPEY